MLYVAFEHLKIYFLILNLVVDIALDLDQRVRYNEDASNYSLSNLSGSSCVTGEYIKRVPLRELLRTS